MSLDLAAAGERLCRRLGGSWSGRSGICRCPAHNDRTPSLSVRLGCKALLFKCHAGCRQDAVLAAIRQYGLKLRAPASHPGLPEPNPQAIETWVRALWARARPLPGTQGAAYLAGRGLRVPEGAPLRFLPHCHHRPSRRRLPALLAACQRPDGSITALHRIYLDLNAPRLSPVSPARMLTNPPGQGAVQLAPAGTTLGLAEGVETALAAMQIHGIPVWAALSSQRLHRLTVPSSVRTLVVFGDNDTAGRDAVATAQSTYAAEGRALLARYPRPEFNDWADALRLSRNLTLSFPHWPARPPSGLRCPAARRETAMTPDPLEDIRTRRIRALNDQLRKNPLGSVLGQLMITQTVMTFLQSEPNLVPKDWLARRLFLLRALANFDGFGPENDPAQEHDFAFFDVWDRRFFFKIDYYDTAYASASPDPADPAVTRRVLTIGFPEDY